MIYMQILIIQWDACRLLRCGVPPSAESESALTSVAYADIGIMSALAYGFAVPAPEPATRGTISSPGEGSTDVSMARLV